MTDNNNKPTVEIDHSFALVAYIDLTEDQYPIYQELESIRWGEGSDLMGDIDGEQVMYYKELIFSIAALLELDKNKEIDQVVLAPIIALCKSFDQKGVEDVIVTLAPMHRYSYMNTLDEVENG